MMHRTVAMLYPREQTVRYIDYIPVIQIVAGHGQDREIYQDMRLHKDPFQKLGNLKAAEGSNKQEHEERVPGSAEISELDRHEHRLLSLGVKLEQISEVRKQSGHAAEEQIEMYLPFQLFEYDPAFKDQSEYAEVLHSEQNIAQCHALLPPGAVLIYCPEKTVK